MPLVEINKHVVSDDRHDSIKYTEYKDVYPEIEQTNNTGSQHVLPHNSYEGYHRWDPEATWTAEEEARAVRKTDYRLLAFFCLMYLGTQMDRGNLSNALTDNFLDDLGLTTTDFNNAVMIQRIAFLLAEFPVQSLVLKIGFHNVFPYMVMAWGTVSWAQAFMQDRAGFFITRALIGALDGGFVPGVYYFFTCWYTSREVSFRYAILASVSDVAHALAGFVAAGVLKMRGVGGKPGWFWLFIIEGTLTFVIGIISALYLPHSPTRTTSVICRKPWYTPDEEIIMVNRILRDDPAKGFTSKKELALNFRDLITAWRDWALWGFFLISVIAPLPILPIKTYLHLNIKLLGFTTFQANMLSVPHSLLQIFTILGLVWSSSHFNERTWHCVFGAGFVLPLLSALVGLSPSGKHWERYTLATLVASAPSYTSIVVAWISESTFDVKKRAVSVATYTTLNLVGAVIASQIYQHNDEPYYYTANKVLIGLAVTVCVVFIAQKYHLIYLNRKRETLWNDMTGQEQMAYKVDQAAREKDGNRRIDFRFTH